MTRRDVLTIWQGINMIALRNRRNSIFTNSIPRSRLGVSSPYQDFRFHAKVAITIYAQLLTKSLTGIRIAFIRGPQGISIELLERDAKYT